MTGFAETRTRGAQSLRATAAHAQPLAWRNIEQARILAFKQPIVGQLPHGYRGGLVLGDSEDDRRLRHTRRRVPVDSFDPTAVFEARLDGRYAYGGMTYRHFGHFMAEMVHRVLPSMRDDPNHRLIFVSVLGHRRNRFELLPEHCQEVYRFLGLRPETVHIVTQHTCVESLYVSQAGSDLGSGPAPDYLDMLDGYTGPRLTQLLGRVRRPKRLYVSRSKLGVGSGLCGERYLESVLEAEGFHVFHPQDYPVTVQMDYYRQADVVMFVEGSACHGAELLGRNAMAHCIMLPRRAGAQQFDPLLEPRCQQYLKFPSSIYLGSMYARPDGGSARNMGISIVDWDSLTQFLRNAGVARLSAASKEAYMAAAEDDLYRYIHAPPSSRMYSKSPELLARLVETFNAATNTA